MNKRKQQAEESSARILRATEKLFMKYGFDNVTIEDICKEAGVSKGLFYHYYKSKQDIILTFTESLNDRYLQNYDSIPEEMPSCAKIYETYRRILVRTIIDEENLRNTCFNYRHESEGGTSVIFDRKRALFTYLKDIIEQGKEKGELRKDISTRTMVDLVFRLAVGNIAYLLHIDSVTDRIDKLDASCEEARVLFDSFNA